MKRKWTLEFWAIVQHVWSPEERIDLRATSEAWMAADHTVAS
jgi:hypothetical protein